MPDPNLFGDPLPEPSVISPQTTRLDPFVQVRVPAPALPEVPDFVAHLTRIGGALGDLYSDRIKARNAAGIERARGLTGSQEFQAKLAEELAKVPNPTGTDQARAVSRALAALGVANPAHQVDALQTRGAMEADRALIEVAGRANAGFYNALGGMALLEKDLAAARAAGLAGPLKASAVARASFDHRFDVRAIGIEEAAGRGNQAQRLADSFQAHAGSAGAGDVDAGTNGVVHLGLQVEPELEARTLQDIAGAITLGVEAGHDRYDLLRAAVDNGLARLSSADQKSAALEKLIAGFAFQTGEFVVRPDGEVADPEFAIYLAGKREEIERESADEATRDRNAMDSRRAVLVTGLDGVMFRAAQGAIGVAARPTDAVEAAAHAFLQTEEGAPLRAGLSDDEVAALVNRAARATVTDLTENSQRERKALTAALTTQALDARAAGRQDLIPGILEALPPGEREEAAAVLSGVDDGAIKEAYEDRRTSYLLSEVDRLQADSREDQDPSLGSDAATLQRRLLEVRAAAARAGSRAEAMALLREQVGPVEEAILGLSQRHAASRAAFDAARVEVSELALNDPGGARARLGALRASGLTDGQFAELQREIQSASAVRVQGINAAVQAISRELDARVAAITTSQGGEATPELLAHANRLLSAAAHEAADRKGRETGAGALGVQAALQDAQEELIAGVLERVFPGRPSAPVTDEERRAEDDTVNRYAVAQAIATRKRDGLDAVASSIVQTASKFETLGPAERQVQPLLEEVQAVAKRGRGHSGLEFQAGRTILGDPNPKVRAAAFAALGATGGISLVDVADGAIEMEFAGAGEASEALALLRVGPGDAEDRSALAGAIEALGPYETTTGEVNGVEVSATFFPVLPRRRVITLRAPIPGDLVLGPGGAISTRGLSLREVDAILAREDVRATLARLLKVEDPTPGAVRAALLNSSELARLYGR